jgi:putative intracellular protease/amidase
MQKITLTALFIVIVSCCFAQNKKILIVATNVDTVGTNASGTYLMEIAYPFKHFTDKGYIVDVVTPSGGKTAIYDAGKLTDELSQIQKDQLFRSKTENSLSPDQVKPKDYVAVFYPGGHGQYWDVVTDERIALITATVYERGGVLGAAGHGTASLIDVRTKDGNYLIKNKRITCFPTWAEKQWMNISEYGKLLPFDMQTVLSRRGANLIVSTKETVDDTRLTRVIDSENRIVTGAFARTAQWVSEEMLKLIEKKG